MKKLLYVLLVIGFTWTGEAAIAQRVRTTVGNSRSARPVSELVQLQGTISVPDANILQQLQQGWQANLSQAGGAKIKVELWQVNYTPDRQDNTYTDIILTQKLDATVSYQPTQGGIQYNLSFRPGNGRLAMIACTYVTPNETVKVTGKPNDGTPGSLTHQFKSNARQYLGNNVIYGIYSLSGQTSNIDFQLKSSTKQNCQNCDFLNDAWNTVTDMANDAANFVKATVDGVGDAVKDVGESIVVNNGIFFVQCFGAIATFLQTGNTPKVRMLSDYGNAYNYANSTIFMNTLPPVGKIIVTNLMSIDKRPFTVPIKTGSDVYILMNLGNAFDDPVNYNMNGATGDVFIHELTHAWQIWHIDNLRLFVDGAVNQFKNTVISNQYRYDCDGHNMTDSYNEEQQAMIVENFYTIMFYHPDGLFRNNNKISCDFEQQWTVQNILGNRPANINAVFTATIQMNKVSQDSWTNGYTGGTMDRALASPSPGNKVDGAGFYVQGRMNNAFFYYSNKTKIASANWGPIRDKYSKDNFEFGELGWPATNETKLPDGAGFAERFDHGYIYWHPTYGGHVILNKIFNGWQPTGCEAGQLGYPIGEYVSENPPKANNRFTETADKGYQKFAHGVIFYALPTVIAAARDNQNYTTVEVGDPDKIITMHNITSTGPRQSENAVANQQQQTPPAAQQQSGTTVRRASDAVEINPQPLPPKIKKAVSKKPAPAAKVEINPQPLPPKNN